MKKLLLSAFGLMSIATTNAQFHTNWPAPANATNTSSATSAGYVGLGIRTLATSTNLPTFNFQVHGTTDFTMFDKQSGGTVNVGKTSRIGLTNSTSGLTANDGAVIRMSDNNLVIENQETGNISVISSGTMNFLGTGTNLYMLNSKSFFGQSTIAAGLTYGAVNIQTSTDNGLFIKTTGAAKVGLGVKVANNTDDAIQVTGATVGTPTSVNFKVKGSGEVYARKYTTTLAAFPDYVFDDNYKLLTFSDLRIYLSKNNRLPNMPSATQIATEGADLGELNRLLVEKVEELTLYILQLEERTKSLETTINGSK